LKNKEYILLAKLSRQDRQIY